MRGRVTISIRAYVSIRETQRRSVAEPELAAGVDADLRVRHQLGDGVAGL
jgi:hypothetical protein